jgi:lauroyl/myristoyl acyltransferase
MSGHLHYKRAFYRRFYRAEIFELLMRLRNSVGSGTARLVARTISRIYTATHSEVLEVVRDNLSLLQITSASRKSAIRVFENFSEMLVDYFGLYRQPLIKAAQICPDRPGEQILLETYRGGKGAILVTAHFGFFELGCALLAKLEIPFTILTQPEPSNALTQWRAGFRAHWGIDSLTIGTDPFGSLEVIRALHQGRFIAMLVDRPFAQSALTIETPGGKTSFSLSAALLAHLAQCPMIPVAIWKAGRVYRMQIHEAIWVTSTDSAGRQSAIEAATRKIAHSLLQNIIQTPEQWYQFIPARV